MKRTTRSPKNSKTSESIIRANRPGFRYNAKLKKYEKVSKDDNKESN